MRGGRRTFPTSLRSKLDVENGERPVRPRFLFQGSFHRRICKDLKNPLTTAPLEDIESPIQAGAAASSQRDERFDLFRWTKESTRAESAFYGKYVARAFATLQTFVTGGHGSETLGRLNAPETLYGSKQSPGLQNRLDGFFF